MGPKRRKRKGERELGRTGKVRNGFWHFPFPPPPPLFFLFGGHVWKSFLGFSASEIINDLGIPISPIIIRKDFFSYFLLLMSPSESLWSYRRRSSFHFCRKVICTEYSCEKREKNKNILFSGKSCISESAREKSLGHGKGGREIAVRRPRGAISSSSSLT